jgi:hypothetical protein
LRDRIITQDSQRAKKCVADAGELTNAQAIRKNSALLTRALTLNLVSAGASENNDKEVT